MSVAYAFAVKYNLPTEEAFNTKRVKESFIEALPTFLLPIIILGGIFGGFVTATEAAGLAVVVAMGLGIYYREVDLKRLRSAMVEGGIQTAVVMLLVAASVLMGGFLTRAQVPQELAQLCRSNNPGSSNRCATDTTSRYRSGSFRFDSDVESGYWTTDASRGFRINHILFDCQSQHLGCVEGQRFLCCSVVCGVNAMHLRTSNTHVFG